MDELEQLTAARLQRRATVAAIEATENWARANGDRTAYIDMVDLYLYSLNVGTAEGLVEIETRARSYLSGLQDEQQRQFPSKP